MPTTALSIRSTIEKRAAQILQMHASSGNYSAFVLNETHELWLSWCMKIKILQKHNRWKNNKLSLNWIFNTEWIEVFISAASIPLVIETICYFCFSSSAFVLHWTVFWKVEFERICVDIMNFIFINDKRNGKKENASIRRSNGHDQTSTITNAAFPSVCFTWLKEKIIWRICIDVRRNPIHRFYYLPQPLEFCAIFSINLLVMHPLGRCGALKIFVT